MALLYDAGLRDGALDAVQAWKEALLAVAVARVATDAIRERRLPFRPRVVDWLALAFAVVVCLYALIPQDVLDGQAGAKAILYGLRHGLVPVVAYFLGRSLGARPGGAPPDRLDAARRRCGARRRRAGRSVRR